MKPRKRITRRVPLPRGKPPRARKKDPAKRRFAKHRNEAFQAFVREQPCVVGEPHAGAVQCCHVRSRGAGGTDIGNCVAMCSFHHELQHVVGMKSFQWSVGLDLAKLAKELGDQWRTAHPGGGPQ